jgi:hypothetical protein
MAWGLGIDVLADAGAEDHRPHDSGTGADRMHQGGSGEVDEAQLIEPAEAFQFQLPVIGYDDADQDQGEENEFLEFDPLGHQTRNDRGGGACEGCLEEKVDTGNELAFAHHLRGDGGIEEQPLEMQPATDDRIAVHQGIADHPVGRHGESKDDQVLAQVVDQDRRGELGQVGGVGGEVEGLEAEQRQGHTGQPGETLPGGKPSHAAQQKRGRVKQ